MLVGSSNKSVTSFLLISHSYSVLSSTLNFTSISLVDLTETVFSFLLSFPAIMGHRHSFLPGWPDEEHNSCSLQSLVVSHILSLVGLEAYCLIKILQPTGSPDFQQGALLPCHACCVHSRLCCNRHSLLLSSYLSRIGRIKNPSCSICRHFSLDTSRLILLCPATDFLSRLLLASFYLSPTSGPGPGELPGFWGSMVFHHASIPRKGSGNNNTNVF